jgi:hypothetical protein
MQNRADVPGAGELLLFEPRTKITFRFGCKEMQR